jgi:hypothetical protein
MVYPKRKWQLNGKARSSANLKKVANDLQLRAVYLATRIGGYIVGDSRTRPAPDWFDSVKSSNDLKTDELKMLISNARRDMLEFANSLSNRDEHSLHTNLGIHASIDGAGQFNFVGS